MVKYRLDYRVFEMKPAEIENLFGDLLKLGLGRMKPGHYEPYLFHKMQKAGCFDAEKNRYSESIAMKKLKIDVKRLRKLKAEADRLFESAGALEPWVALKTVILDRQFDFQNGEIRLQITDAVLREAIEFDLMNQRVILDYSFSRNILRLSLPTFIRFISERNGKNSLPNEFLKEIERFKGGAIEQPVRDVTSAATYKQKDVWDKIESITRSIKNITGAGKDIVEIVLKLSLFQ